MNSSSNNSPNRRFRGSRKALDALSAFSNAPVLKPSGFLPVDSLIRGRSTPEVLVKVGSPKVTVKASTPTTVKVVVSQPKKQTPPPTTKKSMDKFFCEL